MGSMYLVVELGWEYDDNYYFKTDSTIPVEIYTMLELAEMGLERLTVKHVRSGLLQSSASFVSNFTANYDRPILDEDWAAECETKYNIKFTEEHIPYTVGRKDSVAELTPDSFYLEFIDQCDIRFYEIVEIEVVA